MHSDHSQDHESTLAGLGGELGPGNAAGTIPQENALNQHGRGHILGVLRLALIPLPAPARAKAARSGGPVRGTRAALRMTRYKQFSQVGVKHSLKLI
jgi:hypothetical protein